ncbi:MAG TPA: DUF1232 domain-containing protein [Thermoanaerobaculia bacterium]
MTVTPLNEEKFHEGLRDATGDVGHERAQRFYDRLREHIHGYAESKGRFAEWTTDFLLLVPDMFMLLWRLANDPRVAGQDKVLLGSGIAYYIFPLDVVPEALLGPIGFLDDLVFGVYILNKMITDTDPEILREHWSGHEDVLEAVQRVLNAADNLVADDLIGRLKKMMK